MNKYHYSQIYKITNPNTDKVYIGSTIQTLPQRFQKHRWDYKTWKNGTDRKHANSCFIFDASEDINDTKIELIECFECETKRELFDRECFHINNIPNTINSVRGQTKDLVAYNKKRHAENAEEKNKKRRELYANDEEYHQKELEQKRKDYKKHRDKRLAYQIEYKKDPENAAKVKAYQKAYQSNPENKERANKLRRERIARKREKDRLSNIA